MKKLFYLAIAASLFFASCNDDDDVVIDDDNGSSTTEAYVQTTRTLPSGTVIPTTEVRDVDNGGTGTITWTNDRVWELNGFIFVNEGQTLTIDPGTIIKGVSGQALNASALIVAQGGTIIANGTATNPIIFTSVADNIGVDTDGNAVEGGNLPTSSNGLWGGVIVLGNAGITAASESLAIEGIPDTEPRGLYGGTNDADNSGSLTYISIRHGGTNIGEGNEINGLTLGGVGTGTTIDYIEVISNQDDAFEWFGGTVSADHLLAYGTGDESFDYDQGWRGDDNQFWVSINPGDRHGEHDGGHSSCEDCEPFATPIIDNVTYIGAAPGDDFGITFQDNAGGFYSNSIFDFGGTVSGISIEDLDSGNDSRSQAEDNGNLTITNSSYIGGDILYSNGDVVSDDAIVDVDDTDYGVSAEDPVGTSASSGRGAFTEENGNWAQGWTLAFP